MDSVYIAITEYLKQKRIPPNLVIKFDEVPPGIKSLGFKPDGEFWIISRADAEKALRRKLGVPEPIDWKTHWSRESGIR